MGLSHSRRVGRAFLVPATPLIGKAPGAGARTVWVSAAGASRSYPWAVGFFFGNVELSLELWTVIAGISGFDD